MAQEATNNEILEAINTFSTDNDKRLQNIENKLETVENKLEAVENKLETVEGKVNSLPTKDYLDEKMSDLRGDLVVLMRKEDTKLLELVKILKDKKVISVDEGARILKMEPFSQLIL